MPKTEHAPGQPAATRTLYDIVATPDGDVVGCHEDAGVAGEEVTRLDREAADLDAGRPEQLRRRHVVVPREVIATDDPDDGNAPLTGPIVSSETVTRGTLKRGGQPPETHIWRV